MASIDLAIPDHVLESARARAARENTDLSAVVGEFLKGYGGKVVSDEEFERLRQLEIATRAKITNFSASDRLPRDQLYDRGLK